MPHVYMLILRCHLHFLMKKALEVYKSRHMHITPQKPPAGEGQPSLQLEGSEVWWACVNITHASHCSEHVQHSHMLVPSSTLSKLGGRSLWTQPDWTLVTRIRFTGGQASVKPLWRVTPLWCITWCEWYQLHPLTIPLVGLLPNKCT